jgi:pimeloyl-ACP methyl ester carboxylesterase
MDLEPIIGRYMTLPLAGRPHRLYFEEAGRGIPLVCLHTAGADGRQFRHMMLDEEITRHYRVLAFDMPWHGKSLPPEGWQSEDYRLTTADYTEMIVAFCRALALDRPVVMGCSIGGRIVLNLAIECAAMFRALIGLEAADFQSPWYDPAGSTGPTCTAARSVPRSSPGFLRRRVRTRRATRRCGCTNKAAQACSKAISISTASTATCAPGSAPLIRRSAHSTC